MVWTTCGTTAEAHGVAERLFVVIGSDFGRTKFYNSQDGKDDWPISSYVIMEKGQRWTNRAVGETGGLHFAQGMNPRTLARDDASGTIKAWVRRHNATCTARGAKLNAEAT